MRLGVLLAAALLSAAVCSPGQGPAAVNEQRATALALERQGRLSEAEAAWRDVLRLHPSDADACAHLGLLEARQEHYSEAISLYRKALAIQPSMPGVRLNLGLAQFKSGELKEAITTFSLLLRSERAGSPEAQRLTALIGMAHYGLGEYAAAIPFLKKAAASDPANPGFRMALAQSCLSASQFQCVLDVYEELLKLNAGSAEAEMLVGEALDETQNHEGAIEHFRAAVKADPALPNVHFGLGYLLWTQDNFPEAARELQAEVANVPGNAQALAYLADSEIHTGKPQEALPLAEKAIQIDPSIERAHIDLGILYGDNGRPDDAVREFTAAIKLAPDDQEPHWRLARLYQSMGKKDEAKAEFEITRKLHKAEDQSLVDKLSPDHGNGKPPEAPTPNPNQH
jgi:tetratricopeptide (TPR) repeat protein